MQEETREFLDTIMAAWQAEEAHRRQAFPTMPAPSIYGFAYWLCRYSGLVQPPTVADVVP